MIDPINPESISAKILNLSTFSIKMFSGNVKMKKAASTIVPCLGEKKLKKELSCGLWVSRNGSVGDSR